MKLRTIALLSIGLQISACSLIESVEQPEESASSIAEARAAPQTLIAQDFVNALSQLGSLHPTSTTVAVSMSDKQDDFTLAMRDALEQAGYGTRWIEEQSSKTLFQYRKDREQAAGGVYRDIYELAVGSVEMRRGYASDSQQRVRPVTPLYVRGADSSNIVLNDALFDQTHSAATFDGRQGDPKVADRRGPAQFRNNQMQEAAIDAVGSAPDAPIENTASPTLALQNSSRLQVPDEANPLNPLVGRAAADPLEPLPLLAETSEQNVFDLGGSNFQNLLADYSVVKEQVLTFANDSMRLGELNKQLVNQFVETFDPQTDVFSVIGCSMGPTQVEGGNAALALGRADRVVEALRFAGVDDAKILDEGCWAGDGSLDSLPRRGVVLTLNRRG